MCQTIQEKRKRGSDLRELGKYVFFNSESEGRMFGAGFMVKNSIKHTVFQFSAITDSFYTLRMRGMYRKLSVINVHAPTEKKIKEMKKFYEKPEKLIQSFRKYDLKIVMGYIRPHGILLT